MIDEHIADIIAQYLIELNFVTKAAGVAFLLKKPIAQNKEIKVPVAFRLYRKEGFTPQCLTAEAPYDLLPNSAETGIVWFEDLGAKTTASNPRYITMKGQLRLVCWFNKKKIGLDVEAKTLMGLIWQALRPNLVADSYLAGGHIKVSQIAPKRPDPFSLFDLNEAQKQFLSHPYGYFTFVIEYMAMVKPGCLEQIELTESVC